MANTVEHVKTVEHVPARTEQVVIHSYPPLIFIWPIIFLGFFFCFTDSMQWLSPKSEAWIYIVTLVVVVLTIGVDLDRNATIFVAVLTGGIWFAALWLRDVKGFMFFSHALQRLHDMNPVWSRDFGLIVSIILSIFYVIILLKAHLNDRWRFINNEIEHWSFGRSDDAMGRGAKRISTSYPDSLEFLLLLAGTITIYSAQGKTILASIPRVPLLPFRAKRISHIMESVAVSAAVHGDESELEHDEEAAGDTQNLT